MCNANAITFLSKQKTFETVPAWEIGEYAANKRIPLVRQEHRWKSERNKIILTCPHKETA